MAYQSQEAMKTYLYLLIILVSSFCQADETSPIEIKLWPEVVPFSTEPKASVVISEKRPGAFRVTKVTDPVLNVFPTDPKKHNGKAIVICPGGGYAHLAHLHEGKDVAEYFTKEGFTCFVLYYQVPKNRDGALSDAKQAMKLVRDRAKEWNLQADQIGMLGFSAGAHLVARTSVQTDDLKARPDFSILLYTAYLEDKDSGKLDTEFTNLKAPPPFFIVATEDDKKWVAGSKLLAEQLTKENLNHEVHVLPKGGHGFGVKPENPAGKAWPPLVLEWIAKSF